MQTKVDAHACWYPCACRQTWDLTLHRHCKHRFTCMSHTPLHGYTLGRHTVQTNMLTTACRHAHVHADKHAYIYAQKPTCVRIHMHIQMCMCKTCAYPCPCWHICKHSFLYTMHTNTHIAQTHGCTYTHAQMLTQAPYTPANMHTQHTWYTCSHTHAVVNAQIPLHLHTHVLLPVPASPTYGYEEYHNQVETAGALLGIGTHKEHHERPDNEEGDIAELEEGSTLSHAYHTEQRNYPQDRSPRLTASLEDRARRSLWLLAEGGPQNSNQKLR